MTTATDHWLDEHAPLPAPLEPRHEANGPALCHGCGITRINAAAGSFCRDCRRLILEAIGEVVR